MPKIISPAELNEIVELIARHPDGIPNRTTVTTGDGKRHVREVEYPRGHAGNPMTDAEVEAKFHALAGGRMSAARQKEALASLWKLEQLYDLAGLLGLFAQGDGPLGNGPRGGV